MHHKPRAFLPAALATGVLTLGLIMGLASCDSGKGTSGYGDAQTLSVSAASSLKAVMTDLGDAFDTAYGVKTEFNFDASGTLQTQIEAGAPADVFASAAMKQVDALNSQGLLDAASIKIFASNEIVVVVPIDSALGIRSFEDLAGDEVERVTYGDPAVAPHGVAAEEVLTTLGLFDQIKPKVIYAANVTQTLDYVISGEVDAGIVFFTEAKIGRDKIKIAATSEPDWHGTITYPAAVVLSSNNKTLAQAFVDFLVSEDGQAILQRHDFLPAPTE